MSPKQMLRAAARKLRNGYVSAGYPLRPVTRLIRGPMRWYYRRSPLLRHDSRFFWKPHVLSLAHRYLVTEHPKDFLIHRNQIKFRSQGSIMSVQGYYVGEIEHHLVQYVANQIRPGFVMFDVGAHHGAFTLVVAHELRARDWDGIIHSFEPDPDNFALLEYNIRQNDLSRYVVLHQEAAGDVMERQKLVVYADENSGGFLEPLAAPEDRAALAGLGRREVSVTTLDTWIDAVSAAHLVKIDVQGAEPLVLAGGQTLINRFRPILVVEAVEGWPSKTKVREFLLRNRYEIHGVDAASQLCPPDSPDAFVSWDWVGISL